MGLYGVNGFVEHLQDRDSMIRETELDRPLVNRERKDFGKAKKLDAPLLLGGVPANIVPFRLTPFDDWLPTTLCPMNIIDAAPKE